MSNAHELALLEKWADTTAATLTPISISPTSPKATKFCCCPNRRRYNIKQPKKSTLHARNIFIDNDFTYIDDVSNATTKSSSNSCPSEEATAATSTKTEAAAVVKRAAKKESVAKTSQSYFKGNNNISSNNNNNNKSFDYVDVYDVAAITTNNENSEIEEQCRRHEKSCHKTNTNNFKIKSDNGDNNNEDTDKSNDNSCSCFKELFADTRTTTQTAIAQRQQNQGTATATTKTNQANKNTIESNCAVTNATQSGNDNVVAAQHHTIKHQQQQQQRHYNDYEKRISYEENGNNNGECCRHNRIDQHQQQQQQKIQRLSNSELNNKQNNNINISSNSSINSNNNNSSKGSCHKNNNDSNNITQNNCHLDSSTNTTTTTTYNTNNKNCNYCQLHDDEDNENDNNEYDQVDGDISGNNSNNIKIDLQNKMTITTTTNVAANRKRSECGLTQTPTATIMAETVAATTTAAAAAAAAAAPGIATTTTTSSSTCPTSPTSTRPTTPSLTTVIKTTMVKRSPTNESTATTPTTPTSKTSTTTTTNVALVANHHKGATNPSSSSSNHNSININQCIESNEPTRSVKERIAALVAGNNNEQAKTHDNSIKSKFLCIRNNMTTSTPKCTIDSSLHHHKQSESLAAAAEVNVISNKCSTAAATELPSSAALTPAITTSSSSTLEYKFYADIPPRHKSGLNDAERCSLPPPPSASIVMGCATMPRRRSPALAANERRSNVGNGNINNSKYGSNNTATAAMTGADKNFLSYAHNSTTGGGGSSSGDKVTDAAATAAESNSRKLAALDNLDLALSLDLTEEDGEDPYYALHEYLERVKHEINEVFELHKARQKIQQQQQQQEQLRQPENVAGILKVAATAANDELSRSIESDSGFDSASGGYIGSSSCCSSSNVSAGSVNASASNSNKLLAKAAAATAATTTTTRDEKTRRVTEISCQNDINGHAPLATMQPKAPVATATAAKTTNKQQFHVVTTNDNKNETSIEEPTITTKTTTKLKALPPPPLSPTHSNNIDSGDDTSSTSATAKTTSTLKRHHQQQWSSYPNADAAAAAADAEEAATDDVNIWANKFLRDLDNLMASDKPTTSSSASTSPTSKTSPMLLSAAATAAIQSRYGKCGGSGGGSVGEHDRLEFFPSSSTQNGVVLRPEKHTTIPLQSFNLDCGRIDNSNGAGAATAATKSNIAYMRTLSAPTPYHQQLNAGCMASGKNNRNSLATFNATMEQQQPHQLKHHHNLTNFQCMDEVATSNEQQITAAPKTTTILKIEETATSAQRRTAAPIAAITAADAVEVATTDEELLKSRRQRQLENDMETIRIALLSQSQQLAAMEACGSNNTSSHIDNNKYKNMLVASTTAAAATSIPKRERINHATTTKTTSATATTTTLPSTLLLTPSSKIQPSTITATTTSNYLQLNGNDTTKKGSTSTIWTSEESILRCVGAVDEDNNSTSSSACEEASGVLSSGKSGISLDSSGLDNDNNESGIGTATPPKDISYWKSSSGVRNAADNESVSSLDALRKMKFQKSSSVASSDDPDLLEVLSLCDEPHGDEDVDESHDDIDVDRRQQQQQQQQRQSRHHRYNHRSRQHDNNSDSNNGVESRHQHDNNDDDGDDDDGGEVDDVDVDEDDEGHDEFETTIPYCDCDYNDGDASSASGTGGVLGGGNSNSANANNNNHVASAAAHNETNGVVLRRKFTATPIMVPYGRAQKCRSHSLDTSSLPTTYHYHPNHQNLHYHPQQQQQHLVHTPLTRKLHHLQQRTKERGQLSLTLRQEPFQSLLSPTHFHELPSPSSASLHSGHESLGIQELTTKSNSAPLLLKQEKKRDDFAGQKLTLRYSRSQSDRYLAEIEAVEACKWLRAAGFPQYAQMYEDQQFPLDLANVAKDHTNLENDQLQSLYRRLCILNRCANMRLDQSHKAQTPQKEDSDDENFALSENWTFQPHIRRWSRIGEMGLELPPGGKLNIEKTESSSKESSPDRFDDDSYDIAGGLSQAFSSTGGGGGGGDSTDTTLNDSADASGVRLRRTGSERLKDGAKAFLRRVESIKSRRRKRREGIVISGPQALDLSELEQRSSMRKPDAVYSTPPSPSAVSPMHAFPKSPFFGGNELKVPSQSENFLHPNRASPKRTPTTPRSMRTSPLHFFSIPMPHLKEGKSDDSSSYYSDSQESSTGGKLQLPRKTPSKTRRFLQRTGKVDDIGAHSDSECHQGRKLLIKDANSNTTEVKIKKLTRGGSLNLGKDPKKRDGFRTASFRSRSTTRKESKPEDADNIKKAPVVRWHSFQMEERPHMIFRKCFAQKIDPNSSDHGIPFAAMSAGQLQIIRKLALVILTGHMERYCPTHRSGWNWELPKFIKKIKMPDYKDKKVFGVPLLLILQRTGQTLPTAVRAAFRWLQLNALDQIGLFRKSGVKSRIIKLKELIEFSESTAECMDIFDAQQAYDVADMLKQYFRDLPESLLTTKMSETFAAIFQHLPADVRLDAVQCAVLLLPDENREILYALLEFLTLVAANSQYNQMTANNLAVCLAPSLFHSSISTGTASVSASPRRRGKGAGVPDAKELSEAKASHECLSFMIDNYKQIYTASKEKISRCNFGYMEESKPVPLEALGEGMKFHNWRGYLYECTSATIKEGREKTRGWFTITSQNDPYVDIAYKKVGDGHPLRLWRCITEVEGPPKEVLDYIIKQRATWDINLLQCQTIKQLDERTEIFQYTLDGQFSTDFCVLRSWQTDLPRGACVIVETSIDHAKAKPAYGAVRGVVLASRYLIEPCGSGRSRVMHLARVDIKGKTPEWYNKSYGHICSHYLSKIRIAFKNVTDGPESKV